MFHCGNYQARLPADNSFLIAPCGLTYDEVTASSLIKVSKHGDVIDNGSTTLGVDRAAVALHVAAYSANNDLTCVVHIASPPAVSVSGTLERYYFFPILSTLL